jgi:hypothetical protein
LWCPRCLGFRYCGSRAHEHPKNRKNPRTSGTGNPGNPARNPKNQNPSNPGNPKNPENLDCENLDCGAPESRQWDSEVRTMAC